MKPEDKLWLEILLKDEEFAELSDTKLRTELKHRNFPKWLIDLFIEERKNARSTPQRTAP